MNKILFDFFCLYEQGEVQYFIGVQLDGSAKVDPLRNSIPETAAQESQQLVSTLFSASHFLNTLTFEVLGC